MNCGNGNNVCYFTAHYPDRGKVWFCTDGSDYSPSEKEEGKQLNERKINEDQVWVDRSLVL